MRIILLSLSMILAFSSVSFAAELTAQEQSIIKELKNPEANLLTLHDTIQLGREQAAKRGKADFAKAFAAELASLFSQSVDYIGQMRAREASRRLVRFGLKPGLGRPASLDSYSQELNERNKLNEIDELVFRSLVELAPRDPKTVEKLVEIPWGRTADQHRMIWLSILEQNPDLNAKAKAQVLDALAFDVRVPKDPGIQKREMSQLLANELDAEVTGNLVRSMKQSEPVRLSVLNSTAVEKPEINLALAEQLDKLTYSERELFRKHLLLMGDEVPPKTREALIRSMKKNLVGIINETSDWLNLPYVANTLASELPNLPEKQMQTALTLMRANQNQHGPLLDSVIERLQKALRTNTQIREFVANHYRELLDDPRMAENAAIGLRDHRNLFASGEQFPTTPHALVEALSKLANLSSAALTALANNGITDKNWKIFLEGPGAKLFRRSSTIRNAVLRHAQNGFDGRVFSVLNGIELDSTDRAAIAKAIDRNALSTSYVLRNQPQLLDHSEVADAISAKMGDDSTRERGVPQLAARFNSLSDIAKENLLKAATDSGTARNYLANRHPEIFKDRRFLEVLVNDFVNSQDVAPAKSLKIIKENSDNLSITGRAKLAEAMVLKKAALPASTRQRQLLDHAPELARLNAVRGAMLESLQAQGTKSDLSDHNARVLKVLNSQTPIVDPAEWQMITRALPGLDREVRREVPQSIAHYFPELPADVTKATPAQLRSVLSHHSELTSQPTASLLYDVLGDLKPEQIVGLIQSSNFHSDAAPATHEFLNNHLRKGRKLTQEEQDFMRNASLTVIGRDNNMDSQRAWNAFYALQLMHAEAQYDKTPATMARHAQYLTSLARQGAAERHATYMLAQPLALSIASHFMHLSPADRSTLLGVVAQDVHPNAEAYNGDTIMGDEFARGVLNMALVTDPANEAVLMKKLDEPRSAERILKAFLKHPPVTVEGQKELARKITRSPQVRDHALKILHAIGDNWQPEARIALRNAVETLSEVEQARIAMAKGKQPKDADVAKLVAQTKPLSNEQLQMVHEISSRIPTDGRAAIDQAREIGSRFLGICKKVAKAIATTTPQGTIYSDYK